jgi:hypothetical protein
VEKKKEKKLRVEWYRNGKIIKNGNRLRKMYEMGFVYIEILYKYNEDYGEYV